jgi:hypothetical protein
MNADIRAVDQGEGGDTATTKHFILRYFIHYQKDI